MAIRFLSFLLALSAIGCSTVNENIAYSRQIFEEPALISRGAEVYRLFWFAKRRHPVAIIVSRPRGKKAKIELKIADGFSTYNEGKLDEYYIDTITMNELRQFRRNFADFSSLVADDDQLVREETQSDNVEHEDTLIICAHASSYSVEIRNESLSHYISRIACADTFEADMQYVIPFVHLARSHFKQEMMTVHSFKNYSLFDETGPKEQIDDPKNIRTPQ